MTAIGLLLIYMAWGIAIVGLFSTHPFSMDGLQWLTLATLAAAASIFQVFGREQ